MQQQADGSLQLLATGSVHSVNTDRIVLKRYVLTGHMFKINIKVWLLGMRLMRKNDA